MMTIMRMWQYVCGLMDDDYYDDNYDDDDEDDNDDDKDDDNDDDDDDYEDVAICLRPHG